MAPAAPVFAAEAAPTGTARARSLRRTCGSGFTREAGDAVMAPAAPVFAAEAAATGISQSLPQNCRSR
ncbi:hypothetical protein RK21_02779 [Pseudomonas plecoglossicida]|nr:hypothetical protein RK21_02779 [Pseudomonas plecoglossicida]